MSEIRFDRPGAAGAAGNAAPAGQGGASANASPSIRTGTGAGAGASAGAMLRAARESQGLHVAALAAAIKVSPRKLDALENDRLSELPDATFARALAQTVCRTLKIEAAPVLALLPAAGSTPIEPISRTAHAPFRERSGRDAPGFSSGAIRPMIWAAVLLMVAAAVVYLVPESVWKRQPDPVAGAAPVVIVTSPADLASASDGSPMKSLAAAGTAAEALAVTTGATGPADAAASAVLAATPQPTVETVFDAPANAAPASSDASGIVQIRSSQPSWMEVRDATGQVLLSRTVQPGESVGLNGALPMRLTIGNAAYTQVGFRGKPVDMSSSIRDNVARLELR